MERAARWLTIYDVAAEAGTGREWVRRQIVSGRLRATVWSAGDRGMYRIWSDDWDEFRKLHSRSTDDPE